MLVKFSEVRCDYRELDTNLYYIDAWVSDDDDAEGTTVATVDDTRRMLLNTQFGLITQIRASCSTAFLLLAHEHRV